jgi:hypothetical protein
MELVKANDDANRTRAAATIKIRDVLFVKRSPHRELVELQTYRFIEW